MILLSFICEIYFLYSNGVTSITSITFFNSPFIFAYPFTMHSPLFNEDNSCSKRLRSSLFVEMFLLMKGIWSSGGAKCICCAALNNAEISPPLFLIELID